MPENTVYVGRPSRWGNIYHTKHPNAPQFRPEFLENGKVQFNSQDIITRREWCYLFHKEWARRMGSLFVDEVKKELAGKNLACWCPLDVHCHADTLLELANG